MFLLLQTKKQKEWLRKYGQNGGLMAGIVGQNVYLLYMMAEGKVSPEGGFKPLLFSHSWTTQGPESTCRSDNCRCFTEIWQKCTLPMCACEKSSVLHIFAHWVVTFWAISIYVISIESYWHRRSHGYKTSNFRVNFCPIIDKCIREL